MKITTIIGSPRTTGHGAAIANELLDQLGESASSASTYELNRLSYRGCQACMSCKTTSEVCVAKDDLTPVLNDIRLSDLVIISAPIFMGEVDAQAKGLFDRFYSFLGPDFLSNPRSGRIARAKQLVFILTQGNPDEQMFSGVLPRQLRIFSMCGFTKVYPIHVGGAMPMGEAELNDKTKALIAETAKAIRANQS